MLPAFQGKHGDIGRKFLSCRDVYGRHENED
jgi:hypothetical protein